MPTTNEALADRIVQHQTYIQRYGSGTIRRVIGLLNRVDADLFDQIQKRGAKLAAKGFDAGPETTKRLGVLLGEVRALNRAAYQSVGKELTDQLKGLAEYEAEWQASALEAVLPDMVSFRRPPTRLVVAAATARPFQGRLLSEWIGGLEQSRAARLRDGIRIGLVEGQTIGQMVRRIRGSRAAGYADGLMEIDRRGAAAMVRTAVNHTANVAREATWSGNEDILKGVQWHSTLDGRTCAQCGGLDGTVLQLGKGIRPPAHVGCRCTTVPLLKSWRELGLDLDEIPASTRASLDGQVPVTQNYAQWLGKQPTSFQDEVLGKGKAELFRTGKVPIERFVDRNGNELTLGQLKQAQPPSSAPPPPPVPKPAPKPVPVPPQLTPVQVAEADAITYVQTNGLRDACEYAAAYDANGAPVLRKKGKARSVGFFPSEVAQLKGTTLVHNHPSGSSLSLADFTFAKRADLVEIVAVPSASAGEYRGTALMSEAQIKRAHKKAEAYAVKVIAQAVFSGKVPQKDLNVLVWHLVNSAIDHVGAVAYKFSEPPALRQALAAFGRNDFKVAVEAFKWTP